MSTDLSGRCIEERRRSARDSYSTEKASHVQMRADAAVLEARVAELGERLVELQCTHTEAANRGTP